METTPTVREILSRARPVRIAFLVPRGDGSKAILDAIFTRCAGYWGGRFSLIVPCIDNEPDAAYASWLKAYDPDVIYSYAKLSDERISALQEELDPSYLVQHERFGDHEPNRQAFTPRPPIDILRVTTLIPMAAGASSFDAPQRLNILDQEWPATEDGFYQDNFGSAFGALGSGFPNSLSHYAELVRIGHSRVIEQAGLKEAARTELETPAGVLSRIERDGSVKSFIQLSAQHCPRLDFGASHLASSFNLVVGDTFADRLFYWNARALFPRWRDGDLVDLCVPAHLFGDDEFVGALGRMLARRNHVNGHGGSGPSVTTLRSASLSEAALNEIAAKLRAARGWGASFTTETIEVDAVPSARAIEQARELDGFSLPDRSSWSNTKYTGTEARVVPPSPEHLRFAPPSLHNQWEGTWAVEFDIERTENHSRYINVKDRWRLGRRLQMTGAFLNWYRLDSPNGQMMIPRSTSSGLLAMFANSTLRKFDLSVPRDEAAIVFGLTEGGRRWPVSHRHPQEDRSKCAYAERSANGRYFWGAYQLFGSLSAAEDVLLNQFWRSQMSSMGAARAGDTRARGDLRTRLRKIPGCQFDLADEPDIERLVEIVVQEADKQRGAIPSRTWDQLKDAHESLQKLHWEKYPSGDASEYEDWREMERRTLSASTQALCARNILHQGYEHQCRQCFHRAWIAVEAVSRVIRCEVCGQQEPSPVDRPWDFRLNEFLREGLRKHGLWPLFWALSRFRDRSESSFAFAGPLDVFFGHDHHGERKPDTDIDLTIISQGIVRMCEVKQSARQIPNPTLFANHMKRLRPDIATIAIMEEASGRTQAIERRFAEALKGTGIVSEVITLRPERDFGDSVALWS